MPRTFTPVQTDQAIDEPAIEQQVEHAQPTRAALLEEIATRFTDDEDYLPNGPVVRLAYEAGFATALQGKPYTDCDIADLTRADAEWWLAGWFEGIESDGHGKPAGTSVDSVDDEPDNETASDSEAAKEEAEQVEPAEHPEQAEQSPASEGVPEHATEHATETPSAAVTETEPATENEPKPEPEPETNSATDYLISELRDVQTQIYNAERKCMEREARVESLKEDLKDAKAELDGAIDELRELCRNCWGVDFRSQSAVDITASRLATVSSVATESASATPDDTATATDPGSTIPDPLDSDSPWREISITEALKLESSPIKGFGPKKLDALTDLCPTLGDWVDLRRKAGGDFKALADMLPTGIGKDKASELVDRELDFFRDETLRESWGPDVTTASETPSEPATEPATPPETWTEDSHAQQVSARAKEIDDGSEECLDGKLSELDIWHNGYAAYENGEPLSDCPYTTINQPYQDEWLRGWLAAKEVETYENDGEEITADDPTSAEPAEAEELQPVAASVAGASGVSTDVNDLF